MSGTGHTTKSISSTGDQTINGVLSGIAWNDATVYYSFPTSSSEYGYTGEPGTFSSISSTMWSAIDFALDTFFGGAADAGFSVEGFTNLNIEWTTNTGAHIRLANTDTTIPPYFPTTAWAYYPSTGLSGGDVWFYADYSAPQAGNYHWHTILHEIGHALGLKHGQETNVYGALPYSEDSMEYSIMTYRSYVGDPLEDGYSNETWGYAQTYMIADIAALQHMYGADFTTNSGATVYKWTPGSGDTLVNGEIGIDAGGNRIFATIWDGGGIDTYDLSAYTTGVTIDLNPGGFSIFSSTQLAYLGDSHYASGNIYNALLYQGDTRSLIENVIGGSGVDTITGNQAGNILTGNGGGDTIFGLGGSDTIYGNDGTDFLYGGDNDDWLVGGAGQDYLDGGSGYDAVDYAANTTNGTINLILGTASFVGFGYTETLVGIEEVILGSGNDWFYGNSLTNEVFAGSGDDHISSGGGTDYLYGQSGTDWAILSGNRSSYSVFSVNGAQVILDGLDGHDTYLDVEWFQFQDQTIWWQDLGQTSGSPAENDFNGDGKSDILWRHTDGSLASWLMNGSQAIGAPWYGTIPNAWHVTDTADFNGDGKSDLLWRHDGGGVALWLMNGSQVLDYPSLGAVSTAWHIQAAADFNGDGKDDMLWRHNDGSLAIWQMNGSQIVSYPSFGVVSNAWHVQSTGDFNGDGKNDLLWRHDNGSVALWLMNGSQILAYPALGTVSNNWQIQGTGDLNADGKTDIIWRHTDGSVAGWLMDGGQIIGYVGLGSKSSSWHIEGIDDFNGDGDSDLLWRNDNGAVVISDIQNGLVTADLNLGTVSIAWQMVNHHFDL